MQAPECGEQPTSHLLESFWEVDETHMPPDDLLDTAVVLGLL